MCIFGALGLVRIQYVLTCMCVCIHMHVCVYVHRVCVRAPYLYINGCLRQHSLVDATVIRVVQELSHWTLHVQYSILLNACSGLGPTAL